ncbi:MAG TPA: methyltransferase [Vicinamibacterales bacterium]|nr:methyltransferase [Vicinamibacterales bacterium]
MNSGRPHLVATVLAAGALVALVLAQQPGTHPISGRVYALPMGVEGASWLDRPEREREEDPDLAMRLLRLPRGATVADIGAGSGYFTVRLARAVGDKGTVYASDLQPGMLELLKKAVSTARLKNVVPVLAAPDDPKLPAGSIDLALMVDVYHELSQPQTVLLRIREALKPDGRLVLIEYRAEDPTVPIRPEHKMTKEQVRLEVEHEGFAQSRVYGDLPRQHLIVFTKSAR